MKTATAEDLTAASITITDGTAENMNIRSLEIGQIVTGDIDAGFMFQDDLHVAGDITIEGKLFCKDFIFGASGSTLSIPVFEETPPTSSNSPGIKGKTCFTLDYLYVCVDNNTWRRVSLSSF